MWQAYSWAEQGSCSSLQLKRNKREKSPLCLLDSRLLLKVAASLVCILSNSFFLVSVGGVDSAKEICQNTGKCAWMKVLKYHCRRRQVPLSRAREEHAWQRRNSHWPNHWDWDQGIKLVACVVRGIWHQSLVSLANRGSLFMCACVPACFVLFSNVLGFTSFTIGSFLDSDVRSYDLEGAENNMCLSPTTRSH